MLPEPEAPPDPPMTPEEWLRKFNPRGVETEVRGQGLPGQ
jgi:hypothetical protein